MKLSKESIKKASLIFLREAFFILAMGALFIFVPLRCGNREQVSLLNSLTLRSQFKTGEVEKLEERHLQNFRAP